MRGPLRHTTGLPVLGLLLALSACQAPPQAAGEGPPQASAPEDSGVPMVDPQEFANIPAEPEIDDDPAQLMGLDRTGVAALLGEPELRRREPPAEIWQYRAGSCVFDVFLYEQSGRGRVTYLEARDQAARQVEPRDCLHELLRARLDKPLG